MGVEIFNFKPFGGYFFGACGRKVSMQRLGGMTEDNSIENVLVVWIAKAKSGGIFIVGWYKNATIYKDKQLAPRREHRKFKGKIFDYFVKAKTKDSKLLPEDERVFPIPVGKGGKAQYHVWYADKPRHLEFKKRVYDFIYRGKKPKIRAKPKGIHHGSVQSDPFERQRVEKFAIKSVTTHYERWGYTINSVEDDNVGWDLEARLGKRLLRLEVKGLSYSEISVDVTPNEYVQMKNFRNTYRLCIVSNASSKNYKLSIFSFSSESGKWEDQNRNPLKVKEIKSAQLFL